MWRGMLEDGLIRCDTVGLLDVRSVVLIHAGADRNDILLCYANDESEVKKKSKSSSLLPLSNNYTMTFNI